MTDDELRAARQEISRQGRERAYELLLVKGLYNTIDCGDEVGQAAEAKLRRAELGTFDCYCKGCGKETPFIVKGLKVHVAGGGLQHGDELSSPPLMFGLRAVCQRDLTTYMYCFQKIGSELFKIGQMPSMADISFGELKGIDASLDPLDRKELGKALGLFSHDAASGAFVYLRRVFERMIGRAHERKASISGAVDGFDGMRVDQKIDALKDELPEKVVRNSAVFSVLSAGIHELSDEHCKALFPVVKVVIFQMLEQEEHKRKTAIAERETEAAFQALLSAGLKPSAQTEAVDPSNA